MNRRPPDLDDLIETMLDRRADRPVPGWLFESILGSAAEAPQAPRRFTLRDLLPTTPQTRVLWLAATLALLAGAAIAASLLGAPRPPLIAAVSPSPTTSTATPSQSGSESRPPSASATPSATPSPPATPLPPPDGLVADSLAVVTDVGDALRVRTAPGVGASSERLEPLLSAGAALYIVDGPVRADGYDWYEVLPSDGEPTFGWVAAADHDGTAWIRPAPPDCPSTFDVEALSVRLAGELLLCFGSRSISFDGVLESAGYGDGCPFPVQDDQADCVANPGWLAGQDGMVVLEVTGPQSQEIRYVAVYLDPAASTQAAELMRQQQGTSVSITGSFDASAAAGCRLTDGNGADLVPPDLMATVCRLRFVATDVSFDAEAVAIRPDTFVWVIADELQVRTAPGIGADSRILARPLESDDTVFVVAGPVVKDGFTWYQVRPRNRWERPFGWVAGADKDGQPWLQRATFLDCPQPGDWAALSRVSWFAGEHVACFGDQEIVTDVWVHDLQPARPEWTRGCDSQQTWGLVDDQARCLAEPAWLAGFSGLEISPGDPPDAYMGLWVTFDPSAGLTRDDFPSAWTWMTVRGSYSHPAAASCRVRHTDTGVDLLDPAEASFYCRQVFVITSLEPATRPG